MYVITFYSFKGGVGRTMALVNVAAELVRRGRKVLVVDFDLEAPGLETYKVLQPPQEPRQRPGIVEYVAKFRETHEVPRLLDYIYETKPIGKKGGRLWVMPAGQRDAAYHNALVQLDWKRLYRDQHGFLLFQATRMGWQEELNPDYVLIDSRTGDTDVKGICTRQLPDSVVLMFTPNEQNLVGLEKVLHDIRCEETEGLKRKIRLHFVAANVPDLDDEDRDLRRHLDMFRARLAVPHATIQIIRRSETLQMLDQPVFVLQRPHSGLAREYRSLARTLRIANPEDRGGASLFLRELQKEQSLLPPERRFLSQSVRIQLDRITAQFWDDPEILLRVAEFLERQGEPELARIRFDRVLKRDENCASALFHRGLYLRHLRDHPAAKRDLLRYLRVAVPAASVVRGGLPEVPTTEELFYQLQLKHGKHGEIPRKSYARSITETARRKKESARRREEFLTVISRNRRALLELLDISIDAFVEGLSLPAVAVRDGLETSHRPSFWLCAAVERLIGQRRFEDAIRYLNMVKDRIGAEDRQGNWAFLLAMAHWGREEKPSPEYCEQGLLGDARVPQATHDPDLHDAASLQALALLYWGAGDAEKATNALDHAVSRLAEDGEILDGISYWTFWETTPRAFRDDCKEMRRMFQGEPLRPAFLGPDS